MATKVKPVIPAPGSTEWGFKLGDRVRDKINLLEGIATSRQFHITGCDRFSVETDAKDGKPGDTYNVDGNRLELATAFPERHRDEIPGDNIFLGDLVKDTLSNLTGTVHIINVPLHGAIQYDIQPDYDPEKKRMPEGWFVDGHIIEVVKPYTPAPKKVAEKPKTNQAPGAVSYTARGMR